MLKGFLDNLYEGVKYEKSFSTRILVGCGRSILSD